MDLQAGDYIISMYPEKETWNRVGDAIRELQDEHGQWHSIQDLQSDRITATMTYMEGKQLKRTLMLEINGYPKADHMRLELRYNLWPNYSPEIPTAIFEKTVNAIAAAVASGTLGGSEPSETAATGTPGAEESTAVVPAEPGTAGVVYSAESPELPAELLEVGKAAGRRVLNVIEICLLIGLGLAVMNPFWFALACFFGFPVMVVGWSIRDFKNNSATKWKGQSFGMRLLRFTPSIILRLVATAVAMPVIAFGLCIGALALGGMFGGGRIGG